MNNCVNDSRKQIKLLKCLIFKTIWIYKCQMNKKAKSEQALCNNPLWSVWDVNDRSVSLVRCALRSGGPVPPHCPPPHVHLWLNPTNYSNHSEELLHFFASTISADWNTLGQSHDFQKLPQKTFARTFRNMAEYSKRLFPFQLRRDQNPTSLIRWHFMAACLPYARACVGELKRSSFLCKPGTYQFRRIRKYLSKTGQKEHT